LIFSDGVIEAKNPSGHAFGKNGVLALLKETGLSASALLSRIETNLHTHIAEATQLDDITMLAVRRPA
jgi:serine phosphatase RsbU (regulator of sigma subunit)